MPLLGQNVSVVCLAGGKGERLWPRSTGELPKQFLRLDGDKTLLRRTFERAAALVDHANIYVVTGAGYLPLVRRDLPELPAQNLISEPVGRNTAPALGLAAMWLRRSGRTGPLIALPSDHRITRDAEFHAAILSAVRAAEQGELVTVGIQPTGPETGYGYIRLGELVNGRLEPPAYSVSEFVEKPDAPTAQRLLDTGGYLWNSGMLVCQGDALLREIARHLPKVSEVLNDMDAASATPADLSMQTAARFGDMPSISLDFGLLERSDRVVAVPGSFGWHDVGDWTAVGHAGPWDENGNTIRGEALLHEAAGVIVDSGSDRLVAVVGVNDLIVIDTPEAVLVCARDRAQQVRHVTGAATRLLEWLECRRLPAGKVVAKPWGREIWWAVTEHYAAKLLHVMAGHSLSLQYHRRKHETLYFQSGSGRMRLGDQWRDVGPGTVVVVEPGTLHQLEATTALRVIAVSTPDLDDVVRLEDYNGTAGAP